MPSFSAVLPEIMVEVSYDMEDCNCVLSLPLYNITYLLFYFFKIIVHITNKYHQCLTQLQSPEMKLNGCDLISFPLAANKT